MHAAVVLLLPGLPVEGAGPRHSRGGEPASLRLDGEVAGPQAHRSANRRAAVCAGRGVCRPGAAGGGGKPLGGRHQESGQELESGYLPGVEPAAETCSGVGVGHARPLPGVLTFIGISPEGALESSPWRKPWEQTQTAMSPVGAKEPFAASDRSPGTKRFLAPPTGLACFRTGSTGLTPWATF